VRRLKAEACWRKLRRVGDKLGLRTGNGRFGGKEKHALRG
jgi:hypothetical protein